MPATTAVVEDPHADDPDPWRGYQRCLEELGDASHVVVIQDDTIPCLNFAQTVEQIAAARPGTLTSLFVAGLPNWNTRQFLRALSARRTWSPLMAMQTGCVIHVCALLWPADLARACLAWTAENAKRLPGHRGRPRSDDGVVSYWAKMTRQEVWATVPSLVEHPDDVPSTCHRRQANGADRGRVAISWIGHDVDPACLDWTVV